jgi:hypothetical protein
MRLLVCIHDLNNTEIQLVDVTGEYFAADFSQKLNIDRYITRGTSNFVEILGEYINRIP